MIGTSITTTRAAGNTAPRWTLMGAVAAQMRTWGTGTNYAEAVGPINFSSRETMSEIAWSCARR